jgi:hypothetical protein
MLEECPRQRPLLSVIAAVGEWDPRFEEEQQRCREDDESKGPGE